MALLTLTDKVIVVTGASRGVGREMCRAIVRAGGKVALLARASNELDRGASALGPAAIAVPCDVADPASVNAAMDAVVKQFGRIDALVNNAAVCLLSKIETASDADIQREITVNLMGPIYCARAAIPYLKSGGGGDIVNVSSESVRSPFPFLTTYAASKGGLEVLSAGMRTELRPDGIRVTVMRIGNVGETGITTNWAPDIAAEFVAAIQRSGHAAFTGEPSSPQTVADALIRVISLPRDVNVDLIEVRAR